MPTFARILLVFSVLLPATSIWAQETDQFDDSNVLARLSYENTSPDQRGDVRQVCVAITRDGEYRVVRSAVGEPVQFLHGELAKSEFEALKKDLDSPKFRSQSSNSRSLIRQEAESFRAEIPLAMRAGSTPTPMWSERNSWRLDWLNADDSTPFPAPVVKIVAWLQRFQPKHASELSSFEFPNVCPSGGLHLVEPSVALSEPGRN